MKLFPYILTALLCGSLFCNPASYANEQSKRMEELKDAYKIELGKVTTSVDRQYEKALLNLQKKFISENRLEDALLVKKEIGLLKANKVIPNRINLKKVASETSPVPTVESPEQKKLGFKGDHTTKQEDGETIYLLKGKMGATKMMTMPMKRLKQEFPNGLRVRFQYKSSDFVGQGVEMRMEFPSLRGLFTYRNPTLKFDGEWNEYLWPFSDTKEQDMMNYQILLENGEGTIAFKNFEFLAN